MAHEGYHEPVDKLSPETMNFHRAVVSLIEELEAVDWYNQRVDAATDPELKAILAHNRDEEKEHAAMVLEWLRRRDPALSDQLKAYLFKEGPIREQGEAKPASPGGNADGSLGIGSLRHTMAGRGKPPGRSL